MRIYFCTASDFHLPNFGFEFERDHVWLLQWLYLYESCGLCRDVNQDIWKLQSFKSYEQPSNKILKNQNWIETVALMSVCDFNKYDWRESTGHISRRDNWYKEMVMGWAICTVLEYLKMISTLELPWILTSWFGIMKGLFDGMFLQLILLGEKKPRKATVKMQCSRSLWKKFGTVNCKAFTSFLKIEYVIGSL